jgi:hypothetical protein
MRPTVVADHDGVDTFGVPVKDDGRVRGADLPQFRVRRARRHQDQPVDTRSFYHGPAYAGIKTIRDETSSGRMVGVEGAAPGA